MSYSDTTQNYNLPQWRSDDKPSRQDYNEAFASVDTVLANKAEKDYVDSALGNKANKGSPTIIPLQLESGVGLHNYGCGYWKNDFNEVTVIVNAWFNPAWDSADGIKIIGTLPIGFRPVLNVDISAVVSHLGTIYPAVAEVHTAGGVTITPSPGIGLYGAATFQTKYISAP